MLITLMFSVIAVKSRTASSFSYSANEQVCRSWEGIYPDRQPTWPMEIFHIIDIMLSLGMRVGWGAGCLLFSSLFRGLESSLFEDFGLFWEFCEILSGL